MVKAVFMHKVVDSCKSYDMFRVERAIDGPAFQARIGSEQQTLRSELVVVLSLKALSI